MIFSDGTFQILAIRGSRAFPSLLCVVNGAHCNGRTRVRLGQTRVRLGTGISVNKLRIFVYSFMQTNIGSVLILNSAIEA